MISLSLKAGLWGLASGSALILGALLGYFFALPQRVIASVMAFGSGVLISALSFELMSEAYDRGGFTATAVGFVAGAVVYTLFNYILAKNGAKHRKRSGEKQPQKGTGNSGISIAVGSILDGIPESIAIGISMLEGGVVSIVTVIAIFLSNVPESLSSTSGMKKAGRSAKYIFWLWCSVAIVCGIASWCGYVVFANFSPEVIAATTAIAAGAILAMLSDTMIPEAFETAHDFAGLITVLGFLCAFMLSKIHG
jgi:ZIP family zinc transporter